MDFVIYLASPHSTTPHTFLSPEEALSVRRWREEAALVAMAHFHSLGLNVYSPIAHNHRADHYFKKFIRHDGTTEYEHYQRWDEHMISIAEDFYVLELPGYQCSRGVYSEVTFWYSLHPDKHTYRVHLAGVIEEAIGPCPSAFQLGTQAGYIP